jgi:hypothetical protein
VFHAADFARELDIVLLAHGNDMLAWHNFLILSGRGSKPTVCDLPPGNETDGTDGRESTVDVDLLDVEIRRLLRR